MNRMNVRILVHRIPVETPVRTSFGTMYDRPSIAIRIEDGDGHVGWGEVWCNYPSVGAEHRARLLESAVLPLAGESGLLDEPEALWEALSAKLRILAIQAGEPGPLAQCIAGLECALQDLAARRAGKPLHEHLSQGSGRIVAVYASGINPDGAAQTAARAVAAGYAGCKVKVGFDRALDRLNLHEVRDVIGERIALMADANQAWSADEAIAFASDVRETGLLWLEEPIAHDQPDADWARIARETGVVLAAGENFSSWNDFETLPDKRSLGFLQPDIGKWGGLGQGLRVARKAEATGRQFCPHWLGGGIGLLASLHLKAAAGAKSGYVEVDFNKNPMRSHVSQSVFDTLSDGRVTLSESAGLGDLDPVIGDFAGAIVMQKEIAIG
ncbi:mandelate racemase/muconate lactonizing enzyme family protein [Nitratireductor indicus]|uniref:mandelate racemase/muconate lactonizing enzyme family protein n=1 Tax=Nitratireductor indicus TaxID=721133 RepID=UPI002874829B|nr:mandelate racemase/muconate lactonizing enzyme family protein [Nitratireductor indicus]MDS1136165.1 mandelate racemase/muconate lactonizing enzyme family protein [Nitratireductor indicus]